MSKLPAIAALIFFAALFAIAVSAQEPAVIEEFGALNKIEPDAPTNGSVSYDYLRGVATGTNGFYVRYGDTLLMANSGTYSWTVPNAPSTTPRAGRPAMSAGPAKPK